MSNALRRDAVRHHEDALGLLDKGTVLGEVGYRVFDCGTVSDVAEVHVQTLAADHPAAVVAKPLADHHRMGASSRVDDAVATGERPAVFGHRLDKSSHVRGVVR